MSSIPVESNDPDGPSSTAQYDLVCIGFGPATLAIAIALHDRGITTRVLYLEKQQKFAWHAGMMLPGSRMQISFLKDLATLRDPCSKFTFLNYLKSKNRLVAFTNLSTFLPLREEYNDYMSWCASHFASNVQYGNEVVSVAQSGSQGGVIQSWQVTVRNVATKEQSTVTAKNVVVAIGGSPKIPATLTNIKSASSQIIHSSSYARAVPSILPDTDERYNVAVIGGGQSAGEIFDNLINRFPNSYVTLYTGGLSLRPSDDSPFVNEIFDPDRVDAFYKQSPELRQVSIQSDKATNYGVIRPELLDHLYAKMYCQRLHEPNESKWKFKIRVSRELVGIDEDVYSQRLQLKVKDTSNGEICQVNSMCDLVVLCTGYERKGHEILLAPTRDLLQDGTFMVGRDYRLKYRKGTVADDCGIWLQGCCQETHGLGDTLLSNLSVRGAELVDSIFPADRLKGTERAKL